MRKILDAREVAKLWAAERQGLIPDPWLQTCEIVAAIVNMNRGSKTQPVKPEDFLYRIQPSRTQSAESLEAGRKHRQAQCQ